MTDAPFFSGAERALLITLSGLDAIRCRPIVVVGHDAALAAELRARHIETVHIPLVRTGLRTAAGWAASVARVASVVRRWRPDLIHVNDAPSFQPAGYAARLFGVPILAHIRFPDTEAGYRWMLKPRFDRAVFVSDALRRAATTSAEESVFYQRSDVLYDGVLVPAAPDEPTRVRIREELDLPPDRPAVALTGQVSEIKGIWDFVEAARSLVQQGVRATFVVLGDDLISKGAVRRQMEARVREAGLADHFKFLGFRQDAPRVIAAFDIVAVPSHVEPLGNATLEAMAAGKPVVGSNVGGIPEMIVDGETGLLTPPQNPTQLASRLHQLIRDPRRAQAFGLSGQRRVQDLFSVQQHITRLDSIYRGLRRDACAGPSSIGDGVLSERVP